jgi:hypothetical protein
MAPEVPQFVWKIGTTSFAKEKVAPYPSLGGTLESPVTALSVDASPAPGEVASASPDGVPESPGFSPVLAALPDPVDVAVESPIPVTADVLVCERAVLDEAVVRPSPAALVCDDSPARGDVAIRPESHPAAAAAPRRAAATDACLTDLAASAVMHQC